MAKPAPNTIPRNLINAARTYQALYDLAIEYGKGERAAELFAQRTLEARTARGSANKNHIGVNRRREAYQKGKSF
jgi:hypothetical protein